MGTLENVDDYDKIALGDKISIKGFKQAMAESDKMYLEIEGSNERIPLTVSLTARPRAILLAGGLLAHTNKTSK